MQFSLRVVCNREDARTRAPLGMCLERKHAAERQKYPV